jgi:pimeloyl-ACP methyl ester carboxylesterase
MPVRLQQQQLLDQAEKLQIIVKDDHFAHADLKVNVFRWGSGSKKVLLTHGWASKAADFSDLILSLKENNDLQVIAFDAPGNGSSEGELSNLLLYFQSVKTIISNYGEPNIFIGHSLGAMANILAIQELGLRPSLIVSLAPLIKLKENFEATLNLVDTSQAAQIEFFKSFKELFGVRASDFDLTKIYSLNDQQRHWIGHDSNDTIHPYGYLSEFLNTYKFVASTDYPGVGHDKIIKDIQVQADVLKRI